MVFKIIWIALVGSILCGATYLATPDNNTAENPYQTFRRLQQKATAEKNSTPIREVLAHEIAKKLFKAYQQSSTLEFTEQTNYYWCVSESKETHKPLEKWPSKRWIGTAKLRCSQREQVAEISVPSPNGDKNFSYKLLKDQPIAPRPDDLEAEAVCALGIHRNWWIGPEMHEPEVLRRILEAGEWLGKTDYNRNECDVILGTCNNNPAVFFVRRDGLLVLWLKIAPFEQKDSAYDTLIRAKSYSY